MSQSLLHQVICSHFSCQEHNRRVLYGRNPFFIRSFVPTEQGNNKRNNRIIVAIPSSSGHLFPQVFRKPLTVILATVAIPSSSGHLFPQKLTFSERHAQFQVAIPSSSGHLFPHLKGREV